MKKFYVQNRKKSNVQVDLPALSPSQRVSAAIRDPVHLLCPVAVTFQLVEKAHAKTS